MKSYLLCLLIFLISLSYCGCYDCYYYITYSKDDSDYSLTYEVRQDNLTIKFPADIDRSYIGPFDSFFIPMEINSKYELEIYPDSFILTDYTQKKIKPEKYYIAGKYAVDAPFTIKKDSTTCIEVYYSVDGENEEVNTPAILKCSFRTPSGDTLRIEDIYIK